MSNDPMAPDPRERTPEEQRIIRQIRALESEDQVLDTFYQTERDTAKLLKMEERFLAISDELDALYAELDLGMFDDIDDVVLDD